MKVCVLLLICMIGFSVSMWTVAKQSHLFESKASNKSIEYPSLFSSFNSTLETLLWSTFGLIEPENIGIDYNNNADSYLKVSRAYFYIFDNNFYYIVF